MSKIVFIGEARAAPVGPHFDLGKVRVRGRLPCALLAEPWGSLRLRNNKLPGAAQERSRISIGLSTRTNHYDSLKRAVPALKNIYKRFYTTHATAPGGPVSARESHKS